MATKSAKSAYLCNDCGGLTPKWEGQCPHCQTWNTLTAVAAEQLAAARQQSWAPTQEVVTLNNVPEENVQRFSTGLEEFDRVLGGGFVEGSVVLVGGDPGIGKSTLLLQSLSHLSQTRPVLYVTGEESISQIALRAGRLGVQSSPIPLFAEIVLEQVCATIRRLKPCLIVVDSIQTLHLSTLHSAPGSIAQVRECAAQLTRLAKRENTTVVFIGHVTKEGALAGPRVLEHMVDTVLYFEGDAHSSYRLVRAFKNRFGAVNELGVFCMTDRGLRGVANPSALFLSRQHDQPVTGSSVLVTQEGTRPLLVEIQALVDTAHTPHPRRLSVGLEPHRLAMLLAVLNRNIGLGCHDQDVFINAVGGVRISEPAADLAVALAIASSMKNRPLPPNVAVFGEVGLTGEIRPAPRGQERLREAKKLGFEKILMPKANASRGMMEKAAEAGIEVLALSRIEESFAAVWP